MQNYALSRAAVPKGIVETLDEEPSTNSAHWGEEWTINFELLKQVRSPDVCRRRRGVRVHMRQPKSGDQGSERAIRKTICLCVVESRDEDNTDLYTEGDDLEAPMLCMPEIANNIDKQG